MSRKNTGSRQVETSILAECPVPTASQRVARIASARGSNLYEVEYAAPGATADAPLSKAMCRMPSKFKNRVWMKIGDYLIIEPDESGTKSDGVAVLYPDHIKHLQSLNAWPEAFPTTKRSDARGSPAPPVDPTAMRDVSKEDGEEEEESSGEGSESGNSSDDESSSEDDIPPNPNHVGVMPDSDEDNEPGAQRAVPKPKPRRR